MKITKEGFAVVERDTHLSKWVEEHKRLDFDQNSLPQIEPYIKHGGVALDVGANIGCYAYAFSKIAKRVFCFEPNKEAYECLEYNLRDNPRCHIFKLAVSDKNEFYKVVSDNDNVGMARIEVSDSKLDSQTIRIDDLSLEACDFIKIDVEGFELNVLKGAESVINTFKPVMVIEINEHTLRQNNSSRDQIFEWLIKNGYYFRNIYAEQGLEDEQLDIICFPS